jgi:hypothetical protein
MTLTLLQLLTETLLYYLACMLVARSREDAPGLFRVLITVLILALVAGGIHAVVKGLWHSGVIMLIVSFIVLWIGLGIGFFRTIIAALIVALLHTLLEKVFTHGITGSMV